MMDSIAGFSTEGGVGGRAKASTEAGGRSNLTLSGRAGGVGEGGLGGPGNPSGSRDSGRYLLKDLAFL